MTDRYETGNVTPITPDEAERIVPPLPDEVYVVFNALINLNLRGKTARILQKDAVAALIAKEFTSHEIYDKHYLDVEDAYRRAGWQVVYDRPGYNETYEASYTFTKKGPHND